MAGKSEIVEVTVRSPATSARSQSHETALQNRWALPLLAAVFLLLGTLADVYPATPDALLPRGVKIVWDLEKAFWERTPTRERVCLNGLWRWQPAGKVSDAVPAANWGYFKVPGSWPGITGYLQKDSQTVHAHPAWKHANLGNITKAWYEREISIPGEWRGRRVSLHTEY